MYCKYNNIFFNYPITLSNFTHFIPYLFFPQRFVSTTLSGDEDSRHLKDVGGLLSIIGILTSHLTPSGPEYEQVFTWVKQLCVDSNLGMQIPLMSLVYVPCQD
jgi:hypothetical protein